MNRYWRNKLTFVQHKRAKHNRKLFMTRMQIARVLGIKLKDI